MIGLVIISHGDLASSFVSVMELIGGIQPNVKAISIQANNNNMEEQRGIVISAIKEVDQGKGVILLTDLFGGTPSNLAISALGIKNVEVIAGINLPMLLKLISIRNHASLQEAVNQAQQEGRKQIHIASTLLETQQSKSEIDSPSD